MRYGVRGDVTRGLVDGRRGGNEKAHACVRMCARAYVCTCARAFMCARVLVRVCVHICACVYVCTRVRIACIPTGGGRGHRI
jgi:hypothetical protein